jgi:hypothetical protein
MKSTCFDRRDTDATIAEPIISVQAGPDAADRYAAELLHRLQLQRRRERTKSYPPARAAQRAQLEINLDVPEPPAPAPAPTLPTEWRLGCMIRTVVAQLAVLVFLLTLAILLLGRLWP